MYWISHEIGLFFLWCVLITWQQVWHMAIRLHFAAFTNRFFFLVWRRPAAQLSIVESSQYISQLLAAAVAELSTKHCSAAGPCLFSLAKALLPHVSPPGLACLLLP